MLITCTVQRNRDKGKEMRSQSGVTIQDKPRIMPLTHNQKSLSVSTVWAGQVRASQIPYTTIL